MEMNQLGAFNINEVNLQIYSQMARFIKLILVVSHDKKHG